LGGVPRKLRLEFPGANYHVLNRGNYRTDIFRSDGAKAAFVSCLADKLAVGSGFYVSKHVSRMRHELEQPARKFIPNVSKVKGPAWDCPNISDSGFGVV
jgi:hypothetical protein